MRTLIWPPQESWNTLQITVFWCCSVPQVYVNTMTLQHFLCPSSFVLPFLPNKITRLLLLCDSLSRHPPLFFIFSNPKHCGLLDKSSLPSRCLFDSSVVVRSFKKPGKGHSGSQRNGFSKCAAFQFLEILQDLTKVYSSCLEEEADQLLFFPSPPVGS